MTEVASWPVRAVLLALAVLTLVAAGCGDDEQAAETTTSTTSTSSAAPTSCQEVDAPDPKPDGGQTAPSTSLDPDTTYALVVETSCGDFEVTLDQELAPETAASLVSLAEDGFYDNTIFHRVVPGFVIQGGDPTGTGTGGAGYQTVDPPPSDATYATGTVAMAKGGADPPGAASSQFFVVSGDASFLTPDYAIVGEVTSGMETVTRIDALGDAATEQPSQPVVVERITVRES
jgi:cyclophilin family peptidyl-prolyl cis-trans isomerase